MTLNVRGFYDATFVKRLQDIPKCFRVYNAEAFTWVINDRWSFRLREYLQSIGRLDIIVSKL